MAMVTTATAVRWPLAPAQGELIAALAGLIRRGGAARFTQAHVVAADANDFPEAWKPSLTAVHRLLYRVAWHAYLDIEIALNDVRPAKAFDGRMLTRTELELLSAGAGKATFDLAALGNDDIAGRAAHVIGDAFLALAPVDPFRDAAPGKHEVAEAEASVAAVYLGLGVLAANWSMHRRSATEQRGRSIAHEEVVEEYGGISIGDVMLLVAIQDLVRDDHSPALATLLPPQADWLERWRAALEPHEDEVRSLLGLDDIHAVELTRPAAPREPPVAAEPDLKLFNRGRKTFRVPDRGRHRAFFGFVGGIAAFAIPGVGLVAGPIGMALGAVAGWVAARRFFVCSDPECRRVMPTAVETCPGCGGTIAETIKHASDRLDRLEALEGGDDAPAE
jgi:hypothetical protein